MLMFTSGTSGRPRAAMLSHRALLANLDQCAGPRPHPDDRGRRRPARPAAVPRLRAERRPRHGRCDRCHRRPGGAVRPGADRRRGALRGRHEHPGRPADVRRLGAPPRCTTTCAVSGCSPPGPPRCPRRCSSRSTTEVGRPVYEGYGLTETAPVVSSTLASSRSRPARSGGRCRASRCGWSTRPATRSPRTTRARSWSAATNLFSGYWPDGSDGPDADGWWATGDVAYADDDGDLFLVDRRKELVLVSGFNVYPREVEDALAEHADIAEVAVIAVPAPVHRRGGQGLRRAAGRAPACARATSRRTRRPGWPGSSGRRSW